MYNFKKIHSSRFSKVYFEARFSLLKMVALPETATMDDDAYKKEFIQIIEKAEKYAPAYWLVNNAENKFNLSSGLQIWQQNQISSRFGAKGIHKSATVIGIQFILQSVHQQPANNKKPEHTSSQYFTNEEDALLWLVDSLKTEMHSKIISE